MRLSEFSFELPDELIAKYPTENRDDCRMLVYHKKTGEIEHKVFKDLLDYFDDRDVMLINDTQVFPARLLGNKERTGALIEVFLLRELNQEKHFWDVLVDPARKIRVGNKLYFGDGNLVAEVIDNTTSRGRTIRFLFDGNDEEFYQAIDSLGSMPIPTKVIGREPEEADRERFQTIFANEKGAVAAPSAGLHFTPQLSRRLEIKGVDILPVTMHIGLGTFRSVEVEDLTKHKSDSENIVIPKPTADRVNQAIQDKKRVCSVGITTLRAVESSVTASNLLKPVSSWTDKFIFPPYEFKIANALITNFHLPNSTLFMSACAFGGYKEMMHVYEVAIKEKYRFFSFGDAMLII